MNKFKLFLAIAFLLHFNVMYSQSDDNHKYEVISNSNDTITLISKKIYIDISSGFKINPINSDKVNISPEEYKELYIKYGIEIPEIGNEFYYVSELGYPNSKGGSLSNKKRFIRKLKKSNFTIYVDTKYPRGYGSPGISAIKIKDKQGNEMLYWIKDWTSNSKFKKELNTNFEKSNSIINYVNRNKKVKSKLYYFIDVMEEYFSKNGNLDKLINPNI